MKKSIFFILLGMLFCTVQNTSALIINFNKQSIPSEYFDKIEGVIIESRSTPSESLLITKNSDFQYDITISKNVLIPSARVRPIGKPNYSGRQIPAIDVYFTNDQKTKTIKLDIPLGITDYRPKLIKNIYADDKAKLPCHKLIYYYLITDRFIDDRIDDKLFMEGYYHDNDLRLFINFSELLWTLNQQDSDLYIEPSSQLINRIDQFDDILNHLKNNTDQNKLIARAKNARAYLDNLLGLKFYNIWKGIVNGIGIHPIDRYLLIEQFISEVEELKNKEQEAIYQALSLRKIHILNELVSDLQKISFRTCNNTRRSFAGYYDMDLETKPFSDRIPISRIDELISSLRTERDLTKNVPYQNTEGKESVLETARSNIIFLETLKNDITKGCE